MGAEPNTFSAVGLDRASSRRRDADWLASARRDPRARALASSEGRLALAEPDRLEHGVGTPQPLESTEPVLLGLRDGAPLFAVEGDEPPHGARWAGLRDLAGVLSPERAAVAAIAIAIGTWHRRHRFCANCGSPTVVTEAGWLRSCPSCGADHHPRIDPVVIMIVVDAGRDRVLLGRQPSWPAGRYSALAGFVEPGEALEEAVAREVREESGVEVERIRYRSSQPWPFPSSLMLGFCCRYLSGEPSPLDGELEDVRWFARSELSDLILPPPIAIARQLIDEWMLTERSPD